MKKQTQKQSSKNDVKPGHSSRATETRYRLFAAAYVRNGGNGTQAAIDAGYSPKTANEQAVRILANVSVAAMVAELQDKLAKKHDLRADDVIRELSYLVHVDPAQAFGPNGDLLPIAEMPANVRAAIASIDIEVRNVGAGDDAVQVITKKVKFWDKNSAIDKAMKNLGQFERDNMQKNHFQDMTPEQLDKFIARKFAESRGTVH